MESFLQFRKNINSQNGEDGIIEEIFSLLNVKNGNFIEFGAWDGKHFSNTYKLFQEGWSGIYIEGDSEKYKDLVKNFKDYENITCLQEYVGFEDTNSLDAIVDRTNYMNKSFDFVSIDVDGLDYFIFDKFSKYLPKVICIEVNSGHCPNFNTILSQDEAQNNVGQSLTIMSKRGAEKDYFPLCYNGNLFLIKNEFKPLFYKYIKSVEELYIDFLNYVIKQDLELAKYLYNLYCLPNTDQMHLIQLNQFHYIFEENIIMKKFLNKLLFND